MNTDDVTRGDEREPGDAAGTAEHSALGAPPSGGSQHSPLVMVVEDNPVNMRLMRLTLRTRGYDIQEAHDGEEALAWLVTGRPDVILLDMQLPGMDGFGVAAQIKGRVETEHIPIVAVTSYAMAGDEGRALAAGCDAYLAKPIDDAQLLATIERIITQRHAPTPARPAHRRRRARP